MAEALIRGLVAAGGPADRVAASDPRGDRLQELADAYGIHVTADNTELLADSNVLVLAVKPQVLPAVLAEIGPDVPADALVVSICAGVATATIESAMADASRVIRTMPNTPALVGAGATAIARGARATDADVDIARYLFESVGIAVEVDEQSIDAITGLSGSGPGYMFLILESLIEAGTRVGLSAADAKTLAAQTMFGAAKLLIETDGDPAALREMVTSPGGTTLAGLNSLRERDLPGALIAAVIAATERSRELGELATKEK